MATCSHCDYPYVTPRRCPKCGSKDTRGLMTQGWMDLNHPNWINKNGRYYNLNYTPQYPDRHLNGEGYGLYGPQTKTQFNNFKSEYVESKYPIGACDICTIEGDCVN